MRDNAFTRVGISCFATIASLVLLIGRKGGHGRGETFARIANKARFALQHVEHGGANKL